MIVPMKKVSLILLESEKECALKKLRKLGLVHIETMQGKGTQLSNLKEQIISLENAVFSVSDKKNKNDLQQELSVQDAVLIARKIAVIEEEKKACLAQINAYKAELDRVKNWGEIVLSELSDLAQKGIVLSLYEMPKKEYKKLECSTKTLVVNCDKTSVRFVTIKTEQDTVDVDDEHLHLYKVELPEFSTSAIRQRIADGESRVQSIESELDAYSVYSQSMKNAILSLHKDVEFETYATGMDEEILSGNADKKVSVSYFKGYIPAEDLDKLKSAAKDNAWGLLAEDPSEDDEVPTKLKNNKFVSLIYPLTDFLGTVPGYFEYDISGWFLGFILIFFGIIFGDGGYGLLICGVAAALILKSVISKKKIPAAFLLIGLLGCATVLWGLLTCTWFGLSPEQLPEWLRGLSVPVISNVYADKIWYPFWTNGEVGLTTAQNVQIFCFSLALVQLSAAHIKGAVRNRKSLKVLGDIGSVLQLIGMFYVVMSLVVNGAVFSLGLVLCGIPVGIAAIACIGLGFVMSFIFANYAGSIIKSVLSSLQNIVSVLLGVVNVFSDIVSYIRLWAVGLAGAAISATVNELAGPLFGNFVFIIFAIALLVFGHGLNMILNVLSVIVHGIRLNTLEFSSHLDMSWSGHKYKPFEE